jgi:hypothetical protein
MIVKLEAIKRANGNKKSDIDRIGLKFRVHSARVGSGAILPLYGEENKALMTSTVKELGIWDQTLTIITNNTEYQFEIVGG